MDEKRKTPRWQEQRGPLCRTGQYDHPIVSQDEFEKGCRWAGILLAAMFAFLSMGVVLWGW